MMSKIVKKTIGEGEEIKKYFSVCNRYIKIRTIAVALKFLMIFIIISLVLFFIDQTQIIAIPQAQKITENQGDFISENYGIEKNRFDLSMINSSTISEWIIHSWIILAVIFFFLILPIIILYNVFYLKISNEFVFTDQRIIVKRGWIETKIKTIYYNRITDIGVSQSLLERIIKTGTLSISTAGSDGYEAVLWHVKNPHNLKKLLYEIKNRYQQKYLKQHENEYKEKNGVIEE